MKNKNIIISVASYAVATVWYIIITIIGTIFVNSEKTITWDGANTFVLTIFFILLTIGVVFGFKSNNKKESSWAGNFLTAFGIVVILGYFLLMSGFMWY